MSILLFCALLTIVCALSIILIVYHQNCAENVKKLKYSLGFEMKKMETKIEQLKEAILRYHDKIDDANLELDSSGGD